MIVVTNTLSSKKELFKPLAQDRITLYVCGITPYDFAHIGHGRCYVTFDILYRLLLLNYTDVLYCRNFTDIDDKLLDRAQRELGDRNRYHEIAQKYIHAYTEDITQLNCLKPCVEPLVTQTIPEIIALVEKLIAEGYAYEVDGDVYYRVTKFADYGKLSKRKLEDLIAGARVEINDKKENPLDFALWKAEAAETFWKSPWGYGRPGWHIECSAMAGKHLSNHIDIHGGGMDLIFPHHENEIAQSEGAHGKPFARYWMHNAFVRIDKEKMSKSLGNFFTLRDVFAQYDPMVIRYYILQHHYRSPLDFSFDDVVAAQKAYKRLCKLFAAVPSQQHSLDIITQSQYSSIKQIFSFLNDDLNTPGVLGVIFENLSAEQDELVVIKWALQELLGLTLQELREEHYVITPEIQKLIDERIQARAEKNWKRADELRDQLKALGIDIQDSKL